MKAEPTNFLNEDPECRNPYPDYAAYPSYIAKSGDCVKTSYMSYTRIFISSTSGKFEEGTGSWELAGKNTTIDTKTNEELLDNDAAASICMIADFVKYDDPECK